MLICTHSAEAAIALRQRLNETVEQYEALRKEHAELEVQFEAVSRELTIAKSDCEFSFTPVKVSMMLTITRSDACQ